MANMDGTVRIQLTDAHRTQINTVLEMRTEKLRENTDKRRQVAVPMIGPIKQDDLLLVSFKADASASVGIDECEMAIPVTRKTSTGIKTDTYLVYKDLQTADVAVVTGEWKELGSYSVEAQAAYMVGHALLEDSRIYIDVQDNA